MAFVHKGFANTNEGRKFDDRRNSRNKDRRSSRGANFTAASQPKEDKQPVKSDAQCPLSDGTHKLWNCPLFKNMSVSDRYAAVKKHKLCFGCFGNHGVKDCKMKECGINGCKSKHNRLLHSDLKAESKEVPAEQSKLSAALSSNANKVTSFLQILPVTVKHASQIVKTFAFLDTGSSISFINQSLQKLLKFVVLRQL